MSEQEQYRVVLSGRVLPEQDRAAVTERLAELFHTARDTADRLLQGRDVPLKKHYDLEAAERIAVAIRAAGAECRIEALGATDNSEEADMTSVAAETSEGPPEAAGVADRSTPAVEEPVAERAADADAPSSAPAGDPLMDFVSVNRDYYQRQFARFGDLDGYRFALTWHWPAFLAFFFWAMYRKMWAWAILHLVGGLLLILNVDNGLVFIAWGFAWPLVANFLYFRHARRHVLRTLDSPQPVQWGQGSLRPGGTSQMAVILGILSTGLLSASIGESLTVRMLEQYSDRVGELLQDPDLQQTRGDGSPVGEVAGLDAGVAKTSVVMKWMVASQSLEGRGRLPELLRAQLEKDAVIDAWGSPLVLRQDGNTHVLVSAGPDREFDTADDIRQPVAVNSLIQE